MLAWRAHRQSRRCPVPTQLTLTLTLTPTPTQVDVFAYEYSGYGHATGKPCEENLYSVRLVRVRVGVRVSPARRTSTR